MGNSSYFPSFDDFNIYKALSLDDFKKQTQRKMTIYIISNQKEECKTFVELITKQKFPRNSDELLEKHMQNKIDLYSFMNYKIGTDPSEICDKIIEKAQKVNSKPIMNKYLFSELILLCDNDNIIQQSDVIKRKFTEDDKNRMFFMQKPYLLPFLIILSSRNLIKEILPSKTFQFKINLRDIINNLIAQNNLILNNRNKKGVQINIVDGIENTDINDDNIINITSDENSRIKDGIINESKFQENYTIDEEINHQFALFIRKINVIFSYYNELGDEFSFMNSNNKEISITNEVESNSPAFINILLIGESGTGKTTLINLILEEKKSLEGGDGFSTTSKNILVHKKSNLALRFYDVKGLEDFETLQNYIKILKDFNGKNNQSIDSINAIFYCKLYGDTTTVVEYDKTIINELIEFDIPILFLFTKTPYNLEDNIDNYTKEFRKYERDAKMTAIKSEIDKCFKNKNEAYKSKDYINQYIRFYFINLKEDYSLKVPVFGINKVLSFFKGSVPEEDWKDLKQNCKIRNVEKCQELCQKNPFLKKFSNIDKLNEINKIEALKYLKQLKLSSFLTGTIPFIDMISEARYRYFFKNKLKVLYGFEYEEAINNINKSNNALMRDDYLIINETQNSMDIDNENQISLDDCNENFEKIKKDNTKKEENKVDEEIKNKCNKLKANFINGLKRSLDVIIPVVSFTAKAGFKTLGVVFLPLTMIGSGIWSYHSINKDCKKYLDIFDKAFSPLKFKVLENYVNAYIEVINDLDNLGKKFEVIVKDENK